jgi:hypothetical protein
MTLEQQVADLVTATTDLTTVVNAELNKVRAENTTFKNGLATSFSTKTLLINNPGYSVFGITNSTKGNNPAIAHTYAFYNMKAGEPGGLSFDAFALYSYYTDQDGKSATKNIPLVIQDNGGVRLGCHGGPLTGNSYSIGESLQSSYQYSQTVGIGAYAEVSGTNQVQIGGPSATTYTYGAVQNRSDVRDKTDIRPTILGLSFIKSLRPVDFRWDLRDNYRKPAPKMPSMDASEHERSLYDSEIKKWTEDSKISNIVHDGSKKGQRYHHGIIAQELQSLIRATGVDFGGFQDHKIAGGEDVLSVGYPEFIAPLIKAVQELSEMNEALNERVKALEAKVA